MQHLEPDEPRVADRPGLVKTQLAAETLRLYRGDWACFERFCAEQGVRSLPAATETVAAFLAVPGAGRTALARRVAAIDHRHRAFGFPPPGQDKSLRQVLKSLRKTAPRRPRPARPSAAQLERMAQGCGGDLAGRRDRALLLLAAAGLGRGALVGLQAEALRFAEAGATLSPAGPHVARGEPCPVRALEDWLRVSGTRYGPVFRKIDRWGNIEHAALGADAIRRILARRGGRI